MRVVCQSCNAMIKVRDELGGKKAKCPGCGASVTVPLPARAASPVAGPEVSPEAPRPGWLDRQLSERSALTVAICSVLLCPIAWVVGLVALIRSKQRQARKNAKVILCVSIPCVAILAVGALLGPGTLGFPGSAAKSSDQIVQEAFERIRANAEVKAAIGSPITLPSQTSDIRFTARADGTCTLEHGLFVQGPKGSVRASLVMESRRDSDLYRLTFLSVSLPDRPDSLVLVRDKGK